MDPIAWQQSRRFGRATPFAPWTMRGPGWHNTDLPMDLVHRLLHGQPIVTYGLGGCIEWDPSTDALPRSTYSPPEPLTREERAARRAQAEAERQAIREADRKWREREARVTAERRAARKAAAAQEQQRRRTATRLLRAQRLIEARFRVKAGTATPSDRGVLTAERRKRAERQRAREWATLKPTLPKPWTPPPPPPKLPSPTQRRLAWVVQHLREQQVAAARTRVALGVGTQADRDLLEFDRNAAEMCGDVEEQHDGNEQSK